MKEIEFTGIRVPGGEDLFAHLNEMGKAGWEYGGILRVVPNMDEGGNQIGPPHIEFIMQREKSRIIRPGGVM